MNLLISNAQKENLGEVIDMLSANNLPTEDVRESNVQLFIASLDAKVAGIIGLEKYGNLALLRSLAVKDGYKNQKIGEALVNYLLGFCVSQNINKIYLLTTTAEKYFLKLGFQKAERSEIPETIKLTREFKDICPVSAVVMHKNVTKI